MSVVGFAVGELDGPPMVARPLVLPADDAGGDDGLGDACGIAAVVAGAGPSRGGVGVLDPAALQEVRVDGLLPGMVVVPRYGAPFRVGEVRLRRSGLWQVLEVAGRSAMYAAGDVTVMVEAAGA